LPVPSNTPLLDLRERINRIHDNFEDCRFCVVFFNRGNIFLHFIDLSIIDPESAAGFTVIEDNIGILDKIYFYHRLIFAKDAFHNTMGIMMHMVVDGREFHITGPVFNYSIKITLLHPETLAAFTLQNFGVFCFYGGDSRFTDLTIHFYSSENV
jgi:hypothetical protein